MMLLISAFSMICARGEQLVSLRPPPGLPDGALTHLLVRRLSDVEDLSSERENAVTVSADDSESGNGQRFGRVSLSEDQRAFRGVFPTCPAKRATVGLGRSCWTVLSTKLVELGFHMKAVQFFDDGTQGCFDVLFLIGWMDGWMIG